MVVRVSNTHLLKDQDEVKLLGVGGVPAANGSFFVKTSGHDSKTFALYLDAELKKEAPGTGEYQTGGTVYRPFPDDYAIVVGINRYPAFTRLKGPEADAAAFRNWLVSAAGGMMRSDHVSLILSSDYPDPGLNAPDARPALGDVRQAFNRLRVLAHQARNNRVGRRVYLYFSGHGITPARVPSPDLDDAALLMANASSYVLDEHLPGHPYAEWFRNAAAFDEVVLIMDCCRDLKNNVAPIGPGSPLINDRRTQVARFYAVPTELDSKSWEQDLGNPPAPHGVFSFALMEALLNDAVCDSQGRLTGTRLKTYLEKRVPEIRRDQVPRIYPPLEPNNDIVFVARRQSFQPNLSIRCEPEYAGRVLELIGNKRYPEPEARHTVDDSPWLLRVDNGFYKLRISGGPAGNLWELDGSEEVKGVNFP
jgi:hypothetical protein